MKTAYHDSPGTSLKTQKMSTQLRLGHPEQKRQNAGGKGKSCVFRPVEKSPAQTPYRRKFAENLRPSATVDRVHDDVLAEEYAVSSTTLVVVEI